MSRLAGAAEVGGWCGGGLRVACFDLVALSWLKRMAEGLAGFSGSGLEPGVGDELEAALLAAQPVEAEVLQGVGGAEGGGFGADLGGEGGEGGLEIGGGVRGESWDGVGHREGQG